MSGISVATVATVIGATALAAQAGSAIYQGTRDSGGGDGDLGPPPPESASQAEKEAYTQARAAQKKKRLAEAGGGRSGTILTGNKLGGTGGTELPASPYGAPPPAKTILGG